MARTATKKKVKPVNEIENLKKCIQSDQEKLGKLYDKQIEKLKKEIASLSSKKAKTQAKEKVAKGKASVKKMTVKSFAEENELANAKEQLATLEKEAKRYKAEQKVLVQFEKDWQKKEKKGPKKSSSKSTVKAKRGPRKTKEEKSKTQNNTSHLTENEMN